MHVLSIPVVAVAAVTMGTGLYHLFIFDRLRQRRENLTFALTCFSFALYDICCIGLYSSESLAQGLSWQRAQITGLALGMVFFMWFLHDFTKMISKKALYGFTAMGVISCVAGLVITGDLTWSLSHPLIKEIHLPFGITATYYEVKPGLIIIIEELLGLAVLAWMLFVGIQFLRKGPKDKARPLIVALFIVFAGVANDIAVVTGLYSFIYMLEYAYLAMIGFMTYSLIDQVVKGAVIQKTLRESEKRYRLVAENTGDMVWTTDLDFNWTYVSPAVRVLRGYTQQEAMTQPIDKVLTLESLKIMRRILATELELEINNPGPEPRSQFVEMEILKKDGSIMWGESSCTFLRDENNEPVGIIGITRDITERKKAKEALIRSEEKYRTILDAMDEGYYEANLNGDITFANPAASAIIGYTKEEFLGMNNREFTDSETAARMFRLFNRVYHSGIPEKTSEYPIITRDGAIKYIDISVALIKDSDGNSIGFRGVTRNVTELLKVEQERKKLENRLQQAQKMEALGTLAGGVAHDFNNLLMGMQGNVSLMLLGLDQDNPRYKRLKNIELYIKNASGLTKQLLGVARSGKYEVKTTDLNSLVEKTATMFGRTKKEIKIQSRHQAGIWSVEVDHGQIEQVLLNLFVNSWQAMSGGGDIFLRSENIILDEKFTKPYNVRPGKYVKLSVTDTGVGMDEQTRQKAFDPFFTTKEMSRGTGLGLASAYGIIKNHGGIINVYSKKGHGATFNIFLPASDRKIKDAVEPSGKILKGAETLLLIDDEKIIIQTGKELLEILGYNTFLAMDAFEALDIYREKHTEIDMVILDMIMPHMHGNELFDQLRQINPSVKVLLSSGYSIDGQAAQIIKKGCDGFIQKPFSLERLSQKIREIIDGKTA